MVTIWGLRLSALFMFRVHTLGKGTDDYRMYIMQSAYKDWSAPARFILNYLVIWIPQDLAAIIVNSSALYTVAYNMPGQEISAFEVAGIIIWLVGQIFEIVADFQLAKFRRVNRV